MRIFSRSYKHWCIAVVFYSVSALVAHATIGVALQMQSGNPSSAISDANNHGHYLIQRAQYAMDYNDTTREPNWVSWDLTSGDVGSSGRSSYSIDSTLPSGFTRVETSDYSGSGYDRGHMCPSGDRTITAADNSVVFYMSNMIPQASDNNQGVWENFETECRSLASQGNELLIICGPSGFGGSSIPSGVAIANYTWKIAIVVPPGSGTALSRITSTTRVIALKIPNTAGVRSTPWRNFVTNVAQIEADTGYTFFSAFDPNVRSVLRMIVDGAPNHFPAITAQPIPQNALVGGSAVFSVAADAKGYPPLSYQWRKDSTAIPGATNAMLVLVDLRETDAGSYDVVVANAGGSITSTSADLIVSDPSQSQERSEQIRTRRDLSDGGFGM